MDSSRRVLKLITHFIVFALAVWARVTVAQAAEMFPPLEPVDGSTATAVEDLLDSDPPCPECAAYAITAVDHSGLNQIISVAGLDNTAISTTWSVMSQTLWLGNITVLPDYTATGDWQIAAPAEAVADDGYYYFPWMIGTKMQFGSRGVHGSGDYGTTGWIAVDFVSGDNLGSGYAPRGVYASQTATISYVCRDSVSVAIKAGKFLYAHLTDSPLLKVGATVQRGQPISSLVAGSFDDHCGWAQQAATNYHVHWMFQPVNGHFAVEHWVLDTASQRWTNSQTGATAGIGKTLTAEWQGETVPGNPPHPDPNPDPGAPPSSTPCNLAYGDGSSFWDGPVTLAVILACRPIDIFPSPKGQEIGYTILSTAGAIMRVFYVVVKSHFRMGVTILVIAVIAILEPVRLTRAVYMMIKKLVPGA